MTDQTPTDSPVEPKPKRVLYFINEKVEDLLRRYIWTGCTSVGLRNDIMFHATELIRQIIRKQGLHTIYPGQDEASFFDLLQTAWIQVERTLYKFRAKPHCRNCYNPDRPNDSALYLPAEYEYGIITYEEMRRRGIRKCPRCNSVLASEPEVMAVQDTYGGSQSILFRGDSKVFNMWSQVSRTVMLAHIKKEGRDRKNAPSYRDHVTRKLKYVAPEDGQVDSSDLEATLEEAVGPHKKIMQPVKPAQQLSDLLLRFLAEAREMCKYNDNHLVILAALENILRTDEKPADGIIGKLVESSGLSRVAVTQFMKTIRLRSFEFTDSPIARADNVNKFDKRRVYNNNSNQDDDD